MSSEPSRAGDRPVGWVPAPTPPGQPAEPNRVAITPHAERYLLAADAMRRTQLATALLHGGTRSWRERRRVWPAALIGAVLVSLVIAAFAVAGAFKAQKEIDQKAKNSQTQQTQTTSPAGPRTSPPASSAVRGSSMVPVPVPMTVDKFPTPITPTKATGNRPSSAKTSDPVRKSPKATTQGAKTS